VLASIVQGDADRLPVTQHKAFNCIHFVSFPGLYSAHYAGSVEHDPVSGLRSNRILLFRTGLDWILKKTQPDQIRISKLHWSLQ